MALSPVEVKTAGTDIRKLCLPLYFHPSEERAAASGFLCSLFCIRWEKEDRAGESKIELLAVSGRNTQNSCSMLYFCLLGKRDLAGDLQVKSNLRGTC